MLFSAHIGRLGRYTRSLGAVCSIAWGGMLMPMAFAPFQLYHYQSNKIYRGGGGITLLMGQKYGILLFVHTTLDGQTKT